MLLCEYKMQFQEDDIIFESIHKRLRIVLPKRFYHDPTELTMLLRHYLIYATVI